MRPVFGCEVVLDHVVVVVGVGHVDFIGEGVFEQRPSDHSRGGIVLAADDGETPRAGGDAERSARSETAALDIGNIHREGIVFRRPGAPALGIGRTDVQDAVAVAPRSEDAHLTLLPVQHEDLIDADGIDVGRYGEGQAQGAGRGFGHGEDVVGAAVLLPRHGDRGQSGLRLGKEGRKLLTAAVDRTAVVPFRLAEQRGALRQAVDPIGAFVVRARLEYHIGLDVR